MTAPADLLSALSLLLRNGPLRDEFARDSAACAARLNVRPADRDGFLRLAPADLEFQASVLLRKRLHAVRSLLPRTCAALGAETWPRFADYARNCWPIDVRHDSLGFAKIMYRRKPDLVSVRELHRLEFAVSSGRLAVHLLCGERAVQVLVNCRGTSREWLVTLWRRVSAPGTSPRSPYNLAATEAGAATRDWSMLRIG